MLKKILITTLLLAACHSTPQENAPEWYVNTIQNTPSELYGFGAAQNKEQATQNALSNMKERIYTSVSSSIFMNDVSVNGKAENEYSRTVATKVPAISITNYTVDEVLFSHNTYYTRVRASRELIADSVFEQIQKERIKISALFTQYLGTHNEIYKVQLISKLKKQCDAHSEVEHFYNGLGYMTPTRICGDIYKMYYNFKTENVIEIARTNPTIQEMLTNVFLTKFTVIEKSNNIITYKTDVKTEKISGSFLSGVTITIMQHNTSKTYKKHCIGSSVDSAEKATDNALRTCLEQSRLITFEEFFNLK